MILNEPLLWLDLEYSKSRVRFMRFHPSGRYLITVGFDNILRVWDMGNGAEITSVHDHTSMIVTISPDGRYIAAGTSDGGVVVWDTDTFTKQILPIQYGARIRFITFTPDGRYLLFYDNRRDAVISAYDTTTWRLHNDLYVPGLGWSSSQVTFHPTQPFVSVVERLGIPTVWNYETGDLVLDGNWDLDVMPFLRMSALAISSDGRWFFYIDSQYPDEVTDVLIADWDNRDLFVRLHHPVELAVLTQIYLSPDGNRLAVPLRNGTIRLWDTNTWRIEFNIDGYMPTFSPDSNWLIVYAPAPVLWMYDVHTGERVHEFWSPTRENIGNPNFSPDSKLVFMAVPYGAIYIYDVVSGEQITSLSVLPLEEYIWNLKMPQTLFSPDGSFIVISDSGVIRIFAIPTEDMP